MILFSDHRDFTPSESLPPEKLIEVLNGYFAEMVAAIHEQHGMIDKFIGDAVLAVFDWWGKKIGGTGATGRTRSTADAKAARGLQHPTCGVGQARRGWGIDRSRGEK